MLADGEPPPRIYAWSLANIDHAVAVKHVEPISNGNNREGYSIAASNDTATDSDKRVYILGPGNIGRLYASYMTRHPDALPITLVVHRKELLSQWSTSDGIVLSYRDGNKILKSKRFNVEWWSETRPRHGPVREVADGEKLRNVFISTKADAGLALADWLRRYLGRSSSVVFAQNGVSKLWPPYGPLYVARRYPVDDAPHFSVCVVNHGVSSAGSFCSVHAAVANAFIGPINCASGPSLSHLEQMRQEKQSCGNFFTKYISTTPFLDTKPVSSGELWLIQLEKLVMNAAINPLTTLLRCKTGQLFSSYDSQDPLTQVLDKLLLQTSAVIQALINHDTSLDIISSYAETVQRLLPDNENYYQNFDNLRRKLTVRFSQPILKAKLYAFGLKISEHRSSMLQDTEAGRATEIQDFNGWIIEMAGFLGTNLDVSIHRGLIQLIEDCEVLNKEQLASRLL